MSFNTSKVEKGGTVYASGTGVDNRVAIWSGTGTLEGDSDLVFDGTNLGIGTDSPGFPLQVAGGSHTSGTIIGGGAIQAGYIELSDTSTRSYFLTNVGIGTAVPSTLLHLKSTDPVIRLEDTSPDGVYAQIDGAGGDLILGANYGDEAGVDGAIKLSVDNVVKATVDGTGLVFSGGQILTKDTSGDASVKVWAGGSSDPRLQFTVEGATDYVIGLDNDAGDALKFCRSSTVGTTTQMTIDSAGLVGIGGTPTSISASTAALHVIGTNAELKAETSSGTGWAFSHYKTPTASWTVGSDNDDKFRITNSTSFTTDSRFVIDASGLVGIGGTPTRPLHVFSANSAAISTLALENTSTGDASIWFKESSSEWAVGLDNSDSNSFKISYSSELGSNDRLAITTAGLVGIGTAVPTETLHVTKTAADSVVALFEGQHGNTALVGHSVRFSRAAANYIHANTSGGDIRFTVNGNAIGSPSIVIDTGGNLGISTETPTSLLDVRGPTGTGAASAGVLTLATDELTIVDNDQLGRIEFRSPIATAGTDAIVSAAAIWAEANATFSASVNSADIVFATATSGAASEKVRITSAGNAGIGTAVPTKLLTLSRADTTTSATATGDGPTIGLYNTSDTDGNWATTDYFNSSGYMTARIGAQFQDAGDRNTDLFFATRANGGALTERLRITSAGRVTVKNSSVSEISVTHTTGTCDLSTSNNFRIGVSGSPITINLTNATNGQSGVIKIVHDGSAMSFTASQIKWAGGTDPTPSSTNGDIDLIAYHKDNDEIYGVYHNGMAY